MAGNDERPGYALKVIMERLIGYKDYEWTWTEEELEELDEMARRAREIELRNMTGTWAEKSLESK